MRKQSPTLLDLAVGIEELEHKIDRILVNQTSAAHALRAEEALIVAQNDQEMAEIQAISDGLTRLNTDFDAAVAQLEAGNSPAALTALKAIQAQVDALDAKSTALATPPPTPVPPTLTPSAKR